MKKSGNISVVIPNYNNQLYIERCIRSVLDQTYNNIKEIIVVDDASTDNSRNIISVIANEDVRVIPVFLKNNGKVSAARNTGLKRVSSEYVTFLDGDDYYYNTQKIENEMDLLLNNNTENEAIAYSYIVRVDKDDSVVSMNSIPQKKMLLGDIYEKLLAGVTFSNAIRDYCVRTEFIRETGGYNESRSFFEDYEILIKLARKATFYCTQEFGTGYRISENGLSNHPYNEQLYAINEIACNEIKRLSLSKRIKLLGSRLPNYYARRIKFKLGI